MMPNNSQFGAKQSDIERSVVTDAPSRTHNEADSKFTTTYQDVELVLPAEGHCFHCGDPLPSPPFFTHVLGEDRAMCCMGCQLASQSIIEAGLEQYYLDRS